MCFTVANFGFKSWEKVVNFYLFGLKIKLPYQWLCRKGVYLAVKWYLPLNGNLLSLVEFRNGYGMKIEFKMSLRERHLRF